MKPLIYTGLSGNVYTPAALLGTGGEGSVYALHEDDNLVIKIYHQPASAALAAKLRAMVSMANDALLSFSAWPVDVVSQSGRHGAAGFIMHKLQPSQAVHRLFSPFDRKQFFPRSSYLFLWQVAANIAQAMARYHQLDICVGDLNEGNIHVTEAGKVIFVDCDSFQITTATETFYCEVGIPRYTAPELLAKGTFHQLLRTANTDNFALAILIFQLLFLGRHPYTGVHSTQQDIDDEKAIRNHWFAYSLRQAHPLSAPPNTLRFNLLPDELINLFSDAFEGGPRASAPTWASTLTAHLAGLQTCGVSALHYYPPKAKECPWCAFIKTRGIYYFADEVAQNAEAKDIDYGRDLEYFLQHEALFAPPEVETFSWQHLRAVPSAMPTKASMQFFNAVVFLVLIVVAVAIYVLDLGGEIGWAVILGLMVRLIFIFTKPYNNNFVAKKHKELNDEYCRLLAILADKSNQYNKSVDMLLYKQTSAKLSQLIVDYRDLPRQHNLLRSEAETIVYKQALEQFLASFTLADAKLNGLGPSRKKMLASYGITNAAHITSSLSNYSGIGNKMVSQLLSWRHSIEPQFVYIPNYTQILRQQTQLNQQFQQKQQALRHNLIDTIKNLQHLKTQITQQRNLIKKQIPSLLQMVRQAEVDVNQFAQRFGL